MDAQNGFKSWFYSIPPFTRVYLVILLLTGFGGSLGLIDPMLLLFDSTMILKRFELWRLISNFFYIGGPSLNFVMGLMFIMTFSSSFERSPLSCTRGAAGDAADYLFCIFWGAILNIIVAFFLPSFILSMRLMYYLIYVWSKQNPNTPRSFWGITVQGFYIPFALAALSLLMGSSIVDNVIGIGTGHIFYYFSQVCDATKNTPFFVTPHALFWRRMLGLQEVGLNKKDDDLYRRKWVGKGYRLGDS